MPYDPRAVANYILEIARKAGQPVDPMKLQKLVYYAHGWYLALADQPLLDRSVEAWKFGPVVPLLYRTFQEFGASPITEPAFYSDVQADRIVLRPFTLEEDGNGGSADYAQRVIRRVWEQYGRYSAVELSTMTHAPDTPWAEVWSKNQGKRYVPIPDESIRQYFKNALKPVSA